MINPELHAKWKKITQKDPLFTELIEERNLKETTRIKLLSNLTSYVLYNEMTLTELFEEADQEEENNVRAKRRTIIKRLKGYRKFLLKNKMSKITIGMRFSDAKTFYRHFGIEIPYIPPIKIEEEHQEMHYDIPTVEHIKKAVESTNNLTHKALFLFAASSGTARSEITSITIQDFIKATETYHNEIDNIKSVLKKLRNRKDIIPLFEILRQKTNYKYYTCCSPEATEAIITMLDSNEENKLKAPLFGLSVQSVGQIFNRINKKLNWGKRGNYNFFGSHKLRKFNGTALENNDLANAIHGRKRSPIFEAYFKQNPEQIRKEYAKHLDKVTINKTKTYTIKSTEYLNLEKQLKTKDKAIDELTERLNKTDEVNREILEKISKM